MADSIQFSVSCTPVDELTDENSGTHSVIAGEVKTSLGGSGVATVADYGGTAANQGYLNATVNYKEAPDGAGNEVAISAETTASFVFIKNTGHVFSSATALGDVEQSRLLKVTTNSGGIILACLDAGEAIVLKGLQATGTIAANGIEVETVNSDGSEAAGGVHLAVEYLVVD